MLKEISNPHGFLTFSGIGTLLGRGFVRLNGFGSKEDRKTSSQVLTITSYGDRIEWSPTQCVMVWVITKLNNCIVGVWFVYHKSMISDRIQQNKVLIPIHHKNKKISEKRKNSQVMKERENWNQGCDWLIFTKLLFIKLLLLLLNHSKTNCLLTNCPITTWRVN